jgi:hypothetical protein
MSPLVIFTFWWLGVYLTPVPKARPGEIEFDPVFKELVIHPLEWPVNILAGVAVTALLFLAGCFVIGFRPSSTDVNL